jgi:hypothetical protein
MRYTPELTTKLLTFKSTPLLLAKEKNVKPVYGIEREYSIIIHFSSLDAMKDAATIAVIQRCQSNVRAHLPEGFPIERTVHVDENGQFALTPEEKIAKAVNGLSTIEEMEKAMELMLAAIAAKRSTEV